MSESKPSHIVLIIVAVIGVAGTLGAAFIANWDKLFPNRSNNSNIQSVRSTPTEATPNQTGYSSPRATPSEKVPLRDEAEDTPDIIGIWVDRGASQNVSTVVQNGSSFRFTRRGVLPNGVRFESQGSGEISGREFRSTYSSQYFNGATSEGECSGIVSVDGNRMELSCSDSLMGTFPVVAIRQ